MRTLICMLLSVVVISVASCARQSDTSGTTSAPSTGRTLVLDGKETKPKEYISWKCRKYPDGWKTLFEVGRVLPKYRAEDYMDGNEYEELDDKETDELAEAWQALNKLGTLMGGFILYDGTNKGETAFYRRTGLNHRWDWGPDLNYSFIIKPDGTGLYYDFTTSNGGSKSADEVYQCSR